MRPWTFVLVASLTALCGCRTGGHSARRTLPQASAASIADPTFLEQYAHTRRFSAGVPTGIKVVPDGSAVLFLRSPARSFVQDLYEFNTSTGQERLLLTADAILQGAEEQLSPEERARRERMRMSARGIAGYQLSKDGERILVPLSGRLFVIERAAGTVIELESEKGFPIDARFSPDGRSVACVREGDLFVIDVVSGEERQLTTGADKLVSFGAAEFVAQEEMGRREGYWWSPDGGQIVYQRTDTAGLEVMHILDATRPERPPQSWPYPRPGKKNADVQLGIIAREGGETTWIHWDRERYPYLATVRWTDNAPPSILVQNREQTEEVLLSVEPETGSTSILLVERDPAWLNLEQAMPKWLPDGSAFLWMTERNGAWQVELRSRDGRLSRALHAPDLGLRDFVHLDPTAGYVYATASEVPTESHLYRLSLADETVPSRITDERGVHSAAFGEGHEVYVHTASLMDGRRIQNVMHIDGRTLGSLRSVGEQPPFVPNIELVRAGRDPSFNAVLIRPRNFEPGRSYPVIDSVYGGPSSQTVMADPRRYLLQQWIADHGFIVVSIDGRGTPGRGREWERIIKGNLIDVSLNDQVAGLQALGGEYPELDLDRVGIYGWSFGGYFSAMAVMRMPEMFDVAVAGAPVADWLDYDTHYTERYMGLPDQNPEGYAKSSVLTYAAKLDAPLLIVHGTADDNVYFMHSMKMSNELFRAGKHHDFLVLSDFTHMVADPLVTTRLYSKIVGFLSDALRGTSRALHENGRVAGASVTRQPPVRPRT